MKDYYDIKRPLPIMFDMIKGRLAEINRDHGNERIEPEDDFAVAFMETIRLTERTLELLEPFAYPPAMHVVAIDSGAGVRCGRCGKELEFYVWLKTNPATTGLELAKEVRDFASEHAACIPEIVIRNALLTYLLTATALDDASLHFTQKQMLNTIKSILNDAKEGRL